MGLYSVSETPVFPRVTDSSLRCSGGGAWIKIGDGRRIKKRKRREKITYFIFYINRQNISSTDYCQVCWHVLSRKCWQLSVLCIVRKSSIHWPECVHIITWQKKILGHQSRYLFFILDYMLYLKFSIAFSIYLVGFVFSEVTNLLF